MPLLPQCLIDTSATVSAARATLTGQVSAPSASHGTGVCRMSVPVPGAISFGPRYEPPSAPLAPGYCGVNRGHACAVPVGPLQSERTIAPWWRSGARPREPGSASQISSSSHCSAGVAHQRWRDRATFGRAADRFDCLLRAGPWTAAYRSRCEVAWWMRTPLENVALAEATRRYCHPSSTSLWRELAMIDRPTRVDGRDWP